MKNFLKVIIPIILAIIVIFIIGFLLIMIISAFSVSTVKTSEEYHFSDIKKKTSVDFKSCKIITEKDTHGGFFGDGEKKVIYKCSKDFDTNDIESNWEKLPFGENLNIYLYGGNKNGNQYLKDENNYIIPKIEKGYYYFIDDYSKQYKDVDNIYSDEKLLDRNSYNFTLTVYDMDKNYLYYYEIDT